jgi:hypothetical protein
VIVLLVLAEALAAGHHVIRPGETVASIALSRSLSEATLRELNNLIPGVEPPVGTALLLPDTGQLEAHKARVLSVTGSGRITPPEGAEVPLACGTWMSPGTTICTSVESFATVRLAEDEAGRIYDDVRISSSTCVTIVTSAVSAEGRSSLLNISEGSISVSASEQDDGVITVQTPSSLTTGTQGDFRVTIEENAARTEALDEAVVSVFAGGAEVALSAQQGTRVKAGQPPIAPVTLLDTGFLLRPESDAVLVWPDFTWTPVERALGYRVQISSTADFARILHQEDVPYPEWRPDFLLLPVDVSALWWRVTSFDRLGFESMPSSPRRLQLPAEIR